MTDSSSHRERHLISRIGWLRAAVLGTNDGIVSTASLVVGVAAASPDKIQVLVAGLAGLIAGAMSMAAGEYVSVSSQADTEKADLAREATELRHQPESELQELAAIYVGRGVDPLLAYTVAEQMTRHDALGSHARDELGTSEISTARPMQAAFTSAMTFAAGAALPLAAALAAPAGMTAVAVSTTSLAALGILGALSARAGGASALKPSARVLFWGAAAMAMTFAAGKLFGGIF